MPHPALPLLRQILEGRLGLEELRSASFDLGLDYEGLDTRPKLARELLLHLERRNQLERLTAWLTANRPDIDLETLAAGSDSTAASVSLAPTNLPAQLTPFVGREKEMAEIEALLLSPATRLVTLLGPVGIGKTRLAQEMGARLLGRFPDGVFFVNLAAIREAPLVVPTIAHTLNIPEVTEQTPLDSLKAELADKSLLLLLDNFEQVADAAPDVEDLLAAVPRLKVLVTSQFVLRVRAESEYEVGPLPTPDLKEPTVSRTGAADALARSPAVALFVQRAQARKPGFALTSANAAAVAAICARLEGLPLAIELAAAWIRVLTPQAIAARLDRRLEFLSRGEQDRRERRRTLRDALDWSYDLLKTGEKALFRQMGVFAAGAALEAAETICELSDSEPDGPSGDILDSVASLVEKSLMGTQERADGDLRYTMLATIREYALDRLAQSSEADEIRRRHADFFLALAEEAEPQLTGPDQATWLDRLEVEHDNLREALRWATATGETETGLRLVAALWRFWYIRGFLTEGRQWSDGALATPGGGPPELRAKALRGAGVLADAQGDASAAREYFEASLALYRELGDRRGTALTLNSLGVAALNQGDYATAQPLFEEGLATFRALGDKRAIALTLNDLGLIAENVGDLDAAKTHYEESLALLQKLGAHRSVALALNNLGDVARARGALAEAASYYHKSLSTFNELADRPFIASVLEAVAGVLAERGQAERAACLFGAAAALRREIGAAVPATMQKRYDRDVALVRAQGAPAVETAWQAGEAMTLAEAVSYALSSDGSPAAL